MPVSKLIALGLAVGLPLGYALQQGGFCMNTAFRSIIFEKDHSVLRAYVMVILINMVAINLLDEFAVITITMAPFFWQAVIIGGFIFGLGMVLAGGCSSGTCYRMGRGMLGSLFAYFGFAVGAVTMQVGLLRPVMNILREPVIDVYGREATLYNIIPIDHPAVKWVLISVISLAAGIWLLKAPKQKFQIGWQWWKSGLIIGILGVLTWVASSATLRDYGLSFTQPTVSLVRLFSEGDTGGINWATFMLIGVPFGAFAAAKVSGEFSWRVPEPKRLLQQLFGGIIMGLGAALAGGCNIGHGITGASVLAVSSIVATIFTIFGVWAMTYFVFSITRRRIAAAQPAGQSQ